MLDCTSEERVVLEVLNAILSQPVFPTADEPTNQILGVFRHVSDLLRELETFLHDTKGDAVIESDYNGVEKSLIQTYNENKLLFPSSPCGS